jgi:hypothetical protein
LQMTLGVEGPTLMNPPERQEFLSLNCSERD